MKAGIAGLGFALFGLWMLVFAVRSQRRFGASRDWPTVDGVIESSEVTRFTGQVSRSVLFVKYNYTLDGEAKTGSRLALYTVAKREEVEALAERFPVGAEVPVYVEPSSTKGRSGKKRETVLVPGPPPKNLTAASSSPVWRYWSARP